MVTIPSAIPAPPGTDVGDYTTAGYFDAVKETTDALAARDAALKTAVDTLETAMPGKASTGSVTAEATARADADTAEATARAAADTTERQLRQTGDAVNAAAAAAANTTAVAAQASANAVAVRATALEAETARLATLPIASPGRYPEHWAVYVGGDLIDIPDSWVQTSPWGPALRLPAGTEVVSRHIYPTLPGRALRPSADVARAVNTSDGAGEDLYIGAYAVDAVGSVIGVPLALHTVSTLAVSALLYQPRLPDIVLGAVPPAPVLPAGATGVRLGIKTAVGDAYTWFVGYGAVDVSRAVVPPVADGDVTALQAAVNGLSSRTTNLETAIDGPTRRVFATYVHFQAATAEDLDGILVVGLIGRDTLDDGLGYILYRDAEGAIEHLATGTMWAPHDDVGRPIATWADLADRYVPPTVAALRLMGHTVPGIGAQDIRRVPADPGHPYCGQDGLGAWWEIAPGQRLSFAKLGIMGADGKWAPVTAVRFGEVYEPRAAEYTGYNYRVVNVGGGTTGATPPSWPTTIGHTVTDGTVTWVCVKRKLHEEITAAYIFAAARRQMIENRSAKIYRYGGAIRPQSWGGVDGGWSKFWRDKSYQSAGPGIGGFPTYTYPTGELYVERWTERRTIYGVDPDEAEDDCSGNGWQLAFKDSLIEDVIFDGYKAISFLMQSEGCTWRRIKTRNAFRPGGSGMRFTVFRDSTAEDCDTEGDDDTCIIGNGRAQRYSLDGEDVPLASEGGVFRRQRARALQGAVFSVVGGPQENTIGPRTAFNNPFIFADGSDMMIFATGVSVQTLAAGDPCVITGVTDPMVAAAGLTAADVNGARVIETMSPVDPTGFFETDRLLIGITIGAAATATVRTGSPFRIDGSVQFLRVSTVDTDATVTIWFRDHGLASGQLVRIDGYQDGLGGLDEGEVNGDRIATVIDAHRFSIEAAVPASATVTDDLTSPALQVTPYLTGRIAVAWEDCIGESGDSTETGNGGDGTKDFNIPFRDGVFADRRNVDVTHGDQNTGSDARPCHHMLSIAGPMQAKFFGGTTHSPNGAVALIESSGTYDRVTNKEAWYYFEGRTFEAQRSTIKSAYEAQGGRGMSFVGSRIHVNPLSTMPHFKFGYLADDSVEELYLEDTDIIGIGSGQVVFDFSRLRRLILRGRVRLFSADGASGWTAFNFTDTSVLNEFSLASIEVDAGCASLFSSGSYAAIRSRVAAAGQLDPPVKSVIGKAFPTPGATLTYAELSAYSAAQFGGLILATSDGNAGGPGPVYSDGTDWLVLTTGAAISAS